MKTFGATWFRSLFAIPRRRRQRALGAPDPVAFATIDFARVLGNFKALKARPRHPGAASGQPAELARGRAAA